MTPRTNQPSQRALVADDRGAIMVMGIFMCVLLVGALWYIAGIGDALIYRERMQEAADSVAFSAAIIQARGMNIIVMINLIMAAILAIRVAINMAKLICTVLAAVFWAIAAIPFCEAAAVPAGALTDAAEGLQQLDSTISPYIDDALKALHGAWNGIADATPAAAVLGAVEMENKYSPPVSLLSSAPFGASLPTGGGFSLPVVDDSLDKLCDEAGKAVGSVIGSVIPGAVGDLVSGMIAGIVGAAPGYFCELPGSSGGSPPNLGGAACGSGSPAVSQVCDQADAATQTYNSLVAQDASTLAISQAQSKMDSLNSSCSNAGSNCSSAGSGASGGSFTLPDGGTVNTTPSGTGGGGSSSGNESPAGVDSNWHNGIASGSKSSQIIAVLTSDSNGTAPTNVSPRFVNIAGRNKVNIAAPSVLKGQLSSWAQAEFFYDNGGAWSDIKGDAMWNFYWRARFRLSDPGSLPYGEGAVLSALSTSYIVSTTVSGISGIGSTNLYTGAAKYGLVNALSSGNPAVH